MICVAPNGARKSKSDHPHLPITPAELAQEARACAEAGAHVLHLHVRDAAGLHSLAVADYRAAMVAIRDEVGDALLLQVTTESAGRYSPARQMDVVRELRPRAASVALRELIREPQEELAAAAFLAWAERAGVGLQYIVYSPEEAAWLRELTRRRVVPEDRPHALFVLGRYATSERSQPEDLLPFLSVWPPDWPWTMCAFGPEELRCAVVAAELGGHIRVGFENNDRKSDGARADSNAELVAEVRAAIVAPGRSLASRKEAELLYRVSTPTDAA